MGITAENLAERYQISRKEQDELALLSQQRACRAVDEGKFKEETVPIEVKSRKKRCWWNGMSIPERMLP